MSVVDFLVRKPGEPTACYNYKTYEERLLAPLVYFYPQWIDLGMEAQKIMVMNDHEMMSLERPKRQQTKNEDKEDDMDILDDDKKVEEKDAHPTRNVFSISCCPWEDVLEACDAEDINGKDPHANIDCGYSAEVLFSHIKSKHCSMNTCLWDGCQRSFPLEFQLDSHIMRHINSSTPT